MRPALRRLVLAALLLLLLVGWPPEHTRFWEALFDFGHALVMGLAALILRGALAARRPPRGWRPSVLAFALAVALGGGVELLQLLLPGRDASWVDLARDAAGAAAFLLLREAWAGGQGHAARRQWLAAVAGAALLLGAAAVLFRTTVLYVQRDRAMPTLFALHGAWWERELMSTGNSRLTPAPGAARLDLAPGTYPGVSFSEPYPDWRAYRRLVVTIVSDLDRPFPMVIRIHDAAHNDRFEDRFNRRLTVLPGENRFEIPLAAVRRAPFGREMDLSRIRGLMIFTVHLDHPTHVYLRPLRLE